MTPIFPQFGGVRRVRPLDGVPAPVRGARLVPAMRRTDWAHQADGPDRLLRLDGLDRDDMSYALAYLAEYSPGAFDTILDALGPADRAVDEDTDEVPFCTTCGAPLGIFMVDGPYYRHYRYAEDGDCQRHSVDHPTIIGWR